ncbi:MAG TPA: PEP-CTERM sorting domain-containing protein [Phycisphaerae bacterium]|nr:PEP-CTERM sorting domain-containing protein [Phycisphaerae bacterium]
MKSTMLSLTVLMAASTAFAGLTETGSSRFVDGVVNNGLSGGSNVTVPYSEVGPASGSWTGGDYISSFGNPVDPYSDADMYQSSTIEPGHYYGTIYTGVIVDPASNSLNFPSSDAQAFFSVDFTLSTSEDFTLTGWINPYGLENGITSQVTVSIINTGIGGTPTQIIASGVNDLYQPFNVSDTLLAGDYRFEVHAVSNAQALGETYYFNGGADSTWDMSITPEPASLALLAMGGLVCLRRRR